MRKYASVDAVGAVLATLVGFTAIACGEDSPPGGAGAGGAGIEAGPGGPGGTSGATGGEGGTAGAAGSGMSGAGGTTGVEAGADTEAGPDTGGRQFPCINPQPIIVTGTDTGYDRCASGFLRRRAIVACPSELPRAAACSGGALDGGLGGPAQPCTYDSDCSAKPLGHCEQSNSGFYPGCRCLYGCTTDAECDAGQICNCASPIGTCVPSTCTSDGACPSPSLCASYEGLGMYQTVLCPQLGFSCQSDADMCGGNADCADPLLARCSNSPRVCLGSYPQCGLGRPFVVGGAARQSARVVRRDWTRSELVPDLRGLDATERARIAAKWTEAGLMEHASIASFARFALQLLSLGAPVELVIATQQAMADETEHARMCFALASAYAGAPVGPGRLAMHGALDDLELEQVLALVVREGMVGETTAAVEAREALAHATDPVVRSVLEKIAEDETRHAEVAWRFAVWAMERGGEAAREVIRVELAAAKVRAETRSVGAEIPGELARELGHADLRRHGWISAATRAALERDTLVRVVEPCARAVLNGQGSVRAGSSHRSAA